MRMYILTRSDLTKSQRIPQVAHAVAEFMDEFGQEDNVKDWVKNHRTMVCLQCDEDTMGDIMDKFCYDNEWNRSQYKAFIDDDYPEDFGWTAVAFKPMTRDEGDKYFGRLRLA